MEPRLSECPWLCNRASGKLGKRESVVCLGSSFEKGNTKVKKEKKGTPLVNKASDRLDSFEEEEIIRREIAAFFFFNCRKKRR